MNQQQPFVSAATKLLLLAASFGSGAVGAIAQTPLYSYQVPGGGYDAVSNLTQYKDSVNGSWNLQYDVQNRLIGATSRSGVYSGVTLQQQYDSYGNRWAQSVSVAPGATNTEMPQNRWAHYDLSNNRLQASDAASGGVEYDSAGDVTFDGQNQMAYDGEGRVCATQSSVSGVVTQYIYNAEGRRTAKLTGGSLSCYTPGANSTVSATYILGASGEQMTELDKTGTWSHTNIYSAGQLLATYDANGLHFPVVDPLGTVRMQVAGTGAVEESCASLPFGDELTCDHPDHEPTEHHFTGKERDKESGFDYFGARYYASNTGRWLNPDWAEKVEAVPYSDLRDPQSLNLYGYVKNNPLSKADPDGHECCDDLLQFAGGVIQGAASSASHGLIGSPRSSDSRASLAGQILGTSIIGGAGTSMVGGSGPTALGGLALAPETGGASLIISGGAIAASAIGSDLAAGAAKNVTAVAVMMSSRTGDFTKGEKNAMDAKNAADNGGVNKCTNCGQEVQKIQNKAGEPTPGNQLQRHHDPPLSQRPRGTQSPNDRILCKDCHVQEHQN